MCWICKMKSLAGTLVTQEGEVVNPRVREFYSLPALVPQTKEAS